jgi:hypothetical protein
VRPAWTGHGSIHPRVTAEIPQGGACGVGGLCCLGIRQPVAEDPTNCGCTGQVCPLSRPDCCGGRCVTLESHNDNCGACGVQRADDELCVDRVCA